MRIRIGGALRFLFVLGIICDPGFPQQAAPVTLEVFPKDLAVATGESRRVTVVARIGSPIRKLALQALSDGESRVTIGKPGELPEEVRGDVSWPVWISKPADGRSSARVVFLARYEQGDSAHLAQAVLELTVKPPAKVEEVAIAKLEISGEKLEERRPLEAYLEVNNISDVPIEIRRIRASLPSFARLDPESPRREKDGVERKTSPAYAQDADAWYQVLPSTSPPIAIAPRQQHIFRFFIEIPEAGQVLSGKHLTILETDLTYKKDGYSTDSTLVTSKEFAAGVLGETEFVGPGGVPFVLLPGFLFMTLLSLLASKAWPRWSIQFDFKQPVFYLFGTLFSILAVLVYKPVSPWLYRILWHIPVAPRDYFEGYSITDIINVWILALASALLLWVLAGGVWSIFAMIRARLLRDRTPDPKDEPIDLLRKLSKGNKPFNLSEVTVGGKGLWEIPLLSPDPARKWVAGRIQVKLNKATGEDVKSFRDLRSRPSETRRLFELLDRMQKNGDAVLDWDPENQRPDLVAVKDAPPRAQPTGNEFIYQLE